MCLRRISPAVDELVHLYSLGAIQQGDLAAAQRGQVERLSVDVTGELPQDLSLPATDIVPSVWMLDKRGEGSEWAGGWVSG